MSWNFEAVGRSGGLFIRIIGTRNYGYLQRAIRKDYNVWKTSSFKMRRYASFAAIFIVRSLSTIWSNSQTLKIVLLKKILPTACVFKSSVHSFSKMDPVRTA